MTAAGVVCPSCLSSCNILTVLQIMAQLGMLVPARKARCADSPVTALTLRADFDLRLCPVDAILTRMGAYDNMFSNASTFKVELDEW